MPLGVRYPCINNTPMLKSYTPDDLLLLIYNELSEPEKLDLMQAMEQDPQLHQIYQMLLQTVASLDTLNLEPHPSSVEIILEHAHEQEHFH